MTKESDDTAEVALAIVRLAAMSRIEYDRCRQAEAERLGIRVATLDKEVDAARGDSAGSTVAGQGQLLDLPTPEPWPTPVNGATLLDETAADIGQYVVMGEAERDAAALWVAHAHAIEATPISPRLAIESIEPECGKTTLIDVLGRLVPRPLACAGLTGPTLFRTIEAAAPTLMLDEANNWLFDKEYGNNSGRGDIVAIIDVGHRRGGKIIRLVGDDYEPRAFSVFGPLVIALVGHLPGQIASRAITISLRRRKPTEPIQRFRSDRPIAELDQRAGMMTRWVGDNLDQLQKADPDVPEELANRAGDNWRPLFAIADLAGGDWSERARSAALALCNTADSDSRRIMLLSDLRGLFERETSGVLFTKDILAALAGDESRPWAEWKSGKPITDRQLAALLRGFKIRPRSVRRGSKTDKGYRQEDMEDAFARYLPPRSATASQPTDPAGFDEFGSATPSRDVTDKNQQETSVSAGCDGVTDGKQVSSEDEVIWTA
jgi:putative DNA primase/helicase